MRPAGIVAAALAVLVTAGSAGSQSPSRGQAYYHPDAPRLHESLDDYLAWYRTRSGDAHRYDAARPTIGISFHVALHEQQNLAGVDALVRAIEARGANALPLAGHASPALADAFVRNGLPVIDALLFSGERLHLADREAGLEGARRIGVPILDAMHHYGLTAAEFAASPTGLHPALTAMVVDAERDGLIEPMVISVKGAPRGGRGTHEALAAQVAWRVDRALAWAMLRRAPNADKRVVFTYWSEGGGKANVGGDPDDFLDVQASVIRLLHALKAQGYDVGAERLPDRDALARRMALEASNVGTWAPGELAARVRRNEVALLPERTYRRWFEALPPARRAEIVAMWGPPPGHVMVHTDARGQRFLVIPRLSFGNVLIAPHPDWGYLQSEKALMSTGALPPHHQYVAFFLWLRHEWRADAWVSLFSNIVLQPSKAEGPAADDHVGLLLGALPHIHPERLGAAGGVSNKRKGLAQTSGWYNVVVPSDTTAQLGELRASLGRYEAQPDAALRAGAEPAIRGEARRTGVDRALGIDVTAVPFEELHRGLRGYLDRLDRAHMPYGSKVLGDAPEGVALDGMVKAMLGDAGRTAPDAASTRERARDYAERLRTAPREIAGILDALAGRWLEPGPMDEPIHRPDALPPGRALYNFDQAAIPTVEAQAIGVAQAEALVARHRDTHGGAYPTQLAFVVWSSEIARTHGVTEAQMLHLLGTRPVRNDRGEVTGVELIPREELGRPRVDVLASISGVYRDHYLDKVELLAQAVKLAAGSREADNPVAASSRATEAMLKAHGESASTATALAHARVFGEAPGAYAPGIQFLAKSGDLRGDEARMSDLYKNRMSHAYGGGLFGAASKTAFESNLARVDSATFPRSSHVNGMLDNPMPAAFLGGLNLAARSVTGRDIDLFVSNLRELSRPSIDSAVETLQGELRTRYLNPVWLREMMAHGYDGARHMMFLTDHLDLWDSTATRMVTSGDWADVKAVYVDDSLHLGVSDFFERHNPYAEQVLLANLLGAARRGQWNATAAELATVAGRLAESAGRHGAVCEATICRNEALTAFVDETLGATAGGAPLAARYRAAIARARAAAPGTSSTAALPGSAPSQRGTAPLQALTSPAGAPPVVTGRVLETQPVSGDAVRRGPDLPVVSLAAVGAALAAFGWFRARQRA